VFFDDVFLRQFFFCDILSGALAGSLLSDELLGVLTVRFAGY